MPHRRLTLIFAFALGCYLGFPASTRSQAWVPEKGEGSLTFTYQNLDARDHLNFKGTRSSGLGTVHARTTIMDFEYGVTDKLAFNADLTYVGSSYKGPVPEGPSDDGFYHPTFQDLHFHLRYNLLKNPLVVTPFIGVTIPTHDYQVLGHSAIGRGFHELLIGINVGRQLGPMLPNLYVHGRYSYSILKRFEGLNVNRSNAEWEVGWIATKSLTLRFLGSAQKSDGGFDLPIDLHSEQDHEIHDRVARANFVRLGGGASYSLSKSLDINFAYATTIWGRNIHAVGGVALGFTWRFSRGFDLSKTSVNSAPRIFPSPPQAMF